MKLTLLFCATTVLLSLFSCCSRVSELNDPPLPSHTQGWNKYSFGESTTVYGDFVLRKGESVNDGKYGIEAVNLYPAICNFRDEPGADLPSAELRFFKVSDGSTICQVTFKRGAGTLDESICNKSDALIWSVLEINEVNTKQGWVEFNLRLK